MTFQIEGLLKAGQVCMGSWLMSPEASTGAHQLENLSAGLAYRVPEALLHCDCHRLREQC